MLAYLRSHLTHPISSFLHPFLYCFVCVYVSFFFRCEGMRIRRRGRGRRKKKEGKTDSLHRLLAIWIVSSDRLIDFIVSFSSSVKNFPGARAREEGREEGRVRVDYY